MFRAIKNYLFYRKIIKQLEPTLFTNFNVRVDMLCRLYTVFTIPEKEYTELKTQYQEHSEKLIETEFKGYKKKLDNYLMKEGLTEMYGIYLEERANERQFKLGITYKHLDVLFWANVATITGISLLIGAGIGATILLFV